MSLEQFHFTNAAGEEITVPFYQDAVKRKDLKKLQVEIKEAGGPENLDEDRFFHYAKLSDKTIEFIDELSIRDYKRFVEEWMEASELGK